MNDYSNKRITYVDGDGNKVVLAPADCDLTLDQIAAKDVPQGIPYQIVNASDLPPVPAVETYQISKTTPWLRMTDEEAAIMDAVMSETTARLKQIYMAAQYLSSGDALWSTMHDLLTANLPGGNARADALLAPEG